MCVRLCVCLSLQSLFFKLRSTTPCSLNHLSFDVDLPEDDEIQVCTGEITEELVVLIYRDRCDTCYLVTGHLYILSSVLLFQPLYTRKYWNMSLFFTQFFYHVYICDDP